MAPRIVLGLGVLLVIVGIAFLSWPLACIVAGVLLAGTGALFVDLKPKVRQ